MIVLNFQIYVPEESTWYTIIDLKGSDEFKFTLETMTKYKAIAFLIVITAFFSSTNLLSQQDFNKKTPEERAQKQSERMKKALELSDEQYRQVYDIFLNHITEADNIRNSSSVNEDKDLKKEKLKSLRESTHTKINAVLTPEQQVKFEQIIKEMKEKHKGKRNKEQLK